MFFARFPARYRQPFTPSTAAGNVLSYRFSHVAPSLRGPASRTVMTQHRLQSTISNGALAGKMSTLFPPARPSFFLERALSSLAMCKSDMERANSLINFNKQQFNTQESQFLFEALYCVASPVTGLRIRRIQNSVFDDCLVTLVEGKYKFAAMALKDPQRAEGFYLALNPSYFICDGGAVDQNKWFAIDLSILWNKLKKDGWVGDNINPEGSATVSELGRYVATLRIVDFRSAIERFVVINKGQVFPRSLNVGTFRPHITSRGTLTPAVLRTDFRNPAKADPEFVSQIKDGESGWKPVEDLPLNVLSCYPSIINGPSGSGKSVAAHQLTELFASRLTKYSVFSVCTLPAHLMVGKRALERKDTDGLFSAIAIAVVNSITARLHIFGGYSRCLDGALMHCILDEMGSHPEWVQALLRGSAAAVAEINRRLQLAGFEGNLNVHFTIVGTGVGTLPPSSTGSIGSPYWRLTMATDPSKAQRAFLNHHKKKRSYFFEVDAMMGSIAKSPLLSTLSTNMRCAVIIAETLCRKYEHFTSDLSPVDASVAQSTAGDYIQMNKWGSLTRSQEEKYISLLVSLLFTQRHGVHVLGDKDIRVLCCKLGAMEDLLDRGDNPAPEGDPGAFKPLIAKTSGESKTEVNSNYPPFCKPQGAKDEESWDQNTHIRFAISPAVALVALLRAAAAVGLLSNDSKTPSITCERLCSLAVRLLFGALEGAGIVRFPATMLFADSTNKSAAQRHVGGDALDACILQGIDGKLGPTKHSHVQQVVQATFDEDAAACPPLRHDVSMITVQTLRLMKLGEIPTTSFIVEEAPPLGAQSDLFVHSASAALCIKHRLSTKGSVKAISLIRRAWQMGYESVEFTVPFEEYVDVANQNEGKALSADEQGGRLVVSEAIYSFFEGAQIHRADFSKVCLNGKLMAKITIDTLRYRSSLAHSLSAVRSMVLDMPQHTAAPSPPPADLVVLCSPQGALLPDGCAVEFVSKFRICTAATAVCDGLSEQMRALRTMGHAPADDNRKNAAEHAKPVEVKCAVDGSVRCRVVSRAHSLEGLLTSSWLGEAGLQEAQILSVEPIGWHACKHSNHHHEEDGLQSQSLTFTIEEKHFLTILPS